MYIERGHTQNKNVFFTRVRVARYYYSQVDSTGTHLKHRTYRTRVCITRVNPVGRSRATHYRHPICVRTRVRVRTDGRLLIVTHVLITAARARMNIIFVQQIRRGRRASYPGSGYTTSMPYARELAKAPAYKRIFPGGQIRADRSNRDHAGKVIPFRPSSGCFGIRARSTPSSVPSTAAASFKNTVELADVLRSFVSTRLSNPLKSARCNGAMITKRRALPSIPVRDVISISRTVTRTPPGRYTRRVREYGRRIVCFGFSLHGWPRSRRCSPHVVKRARAVFPCSVPQQVRRGRRNTDERPGFACSSHLRRGPRGV